MLKNKTLIIVVAVIILLLLGGVAYLSLSKSSTKKSESVKTTPTPTTSANSGNNTTLTGLLALGQNLRCSFNFNGTSGTTTQGTFYISSGNLRGDFVVKNTDGKETQMSMIRNGDESYVWGPSLPMGIKMKITLDKLAANEQVGQFANVNQKTNYNCLPWKVDSSLFTPPSNIKFNDMSNLIPNASAVPSAKTGTPALNPSVCDQITDPTGKAACLKALSGQQ